MLFKWAHRQDENFTTEAFAYLLRRLLENEPDKGVELLRFLTDEQLCVRPDRAQTVAVTTQVTIDEGRPDLEIRTLDHLVYVEVKDGSGLGDSQLQRYRQALSSHPTGLSTTLVLLTRYAVDTSEDPLAVPRRWHQIAEWLEDRLEASRWDSIEARFLTCQFVEYLRIRGMTMDQVTWELKNGVRAAMNLLDMVYEGLGNHAPKPKASFGQQWAGYWTDDSKKAEAWVGINWSDPTVLVFHSHSMTVDEKMVSEVGFGECDAKQGRWYHRMDLESEEEHFFARSKANQQMRVEEFLQRAFAGISKLKGLSGVSG